MLLLFEIDEGFANGLLGRFRDDLAGLDKCLTNIRAGLAPLARKYDVAVLVYPCQAYLSSGSTSTNADRLASVHPVLKRLLAFFAQRPTGAPRIGVFLEVYSSGIATQQSGELGRLPMPLLGVGSDDHGRSGLSMDIETLGALADAYKDVFWGIRFHEVYGSDIVWKVRPEGEKRGFVMDEQVVRACIDLCRRKRLRLLWSDSNWLMKCPPATGEPNYIYSDDHRPYFQSEPYRSLQEEAERQLGSRLCFSWANNNYHTTQNLEFLNEEIGPSKPTRARALPNWLFFKMPFQEFPLKRRRMAQWGMSIQSWFWHEMTYTLTGHYYLSGELACPVEVMLAYVGKGLREGAAVLQFEPGWYFFNEEMLGKPDYPGVYEQAPDFSERLALKRLKQMLLNPTPASTPPDRLDALFDRHQQRFHENDYTDPPKNYAQSTLGLAWSSQGSKPILSCFDFYSYGPRWLSQDKDRFGTWLFEGGVEAAQRIELEGDGVDELLIIRRETGGKRRITFYNQNSGWMGEDELIATDNAEGTFVGLTTANVIPETVGQGDPDEIIVARKPHSGARINLQIYKMTRIAGDQLSFRYTPLPSDQNRTLLERLVDPASLQAERFVGITGLRADARLFANNTRSTDHLVVVTRGGKDLLATVKREGKFVSAMLPGIPANTPDLMLCSIDTELMGTDALCFVWKKIGRSQTAPVGSALWLSALFRLEGSHFAPIGQHDVTPPRTASGHLPCLVALRKRILLNAGRP